MFGRKDERRIRCLAGFQQCIGRRQSVGDDNRRRLGLEQFVKLVRETALADAHCPVVFGPSHDLHALGMNDVDVTDHIGAIVARTLDFYAAVNPLTGHPVKQQLFAVVFVKLVQTDVTCHRMI